MLRSSSGTGLAPAFLRQWRDPKVVLRAILGALLGANLVAAGLVLFPPGGSAEDLERQLASLQSQIQSRQVVLERTRRHTDEVEKGRMQGDEFLSDYFLPLRSHTSALFTELEAAATEAKIKPRELALAIEPVEGSDTLSMLTITANYEGAYTDLLHFVHEVDRSPRLLIIESLNAAPVQGSGQLSISMKLESFVREDGAEASTEEPKNVASVGSSAEASGGRP
jgi:Tfp pilus assembly protein PilO